MSFKNIDLSVKPVDLELFLCKPDRQIIGKLTNAYSKVHNLKLGNIHDITFSVPYTMEIGHKPQRDRHVDKIMDRYLIKAKTGSVEEWYVIRKIEEVSDDNADVKSVTAYLLPYEMNDKLIRAYQEDGLNLSGVLNGGAIRTDESGNTYTVIGILDSTDWTVGYVDAEFDIKYRSFEFSSVTVLDAIFQIADTFQALIVWDTENKKINFYNADTYGLNRGLTISSGNYMKSANKETNSDEMVTRLKVEGNDGLTFAKVNPTGMPWIEDFSYFLYPFSRKKVNISNDQDWDGLSAYKWVTVKSSNYMSDELCHALLNYKEFADNKKDEFNNLFDQFSNIGTILKKRQDEMSTLTEQMAAIQNNLDIVNAAGGDSSAYVAQKNAQQALINSKQTEINGVQSQLNDVNVKIRALQASLSTDNFMSPKLIIELNKFIVEKEWVDTNYVEGQEQELYNAALKYYEKLREPQVVISIDSVNFLSIVEAQRDWDKFYLGDIVTVRNENIGANITARLIEASINYEDDTMTLTIANTKDILTDEEKLFKMIYNSTGVSTTVSLSRSKWDYANATVSKIDTIINATWDAVNREIIAGVNESVEIGARGLLIKDPNDPMRYLVAQHGVLALTKDGGNTWKTALTPDGVVAERLFGKILAGVNLTIDASDASGTKLFTVDGNGVTIAGTKLTITGGLPPTQLDPTFKDSLVNLAKPYNGVVIDAANGLVITKSDNTIRTVLNAVDGLKFQKNVSGTWVDRLYYDATSGNLVVDGSINAKELKVNGVNVLTAANKIDGKYIDTLTIQNLVVGNNVSMGANATIDWVQVTSKPSIPTSSDIASIANTRITSTLVSSPVIQGALIQGGTITSNAQIDVGTDLKVGNNIYLGSGSSVTKRIIFNGSAQMYSIDSTQIKISAQNTYINDGGVFLGAGSASPIVIKGQMDLTGVASINWGTNAPPTTAVFG